MTYCPGAVSLKMTLLADGNEKLSSAGSVVMALSPELRNDLLGAEVWKEPSGLNLTPRLPAASTETSGPSTAEIRLRFSELGFVNRSPYSDITGD